MSIHDEHRQRLKSRFLSEGMDHFADHEVLELLLFYAIPKKDTNELAHALLDRFGSLHSVLEADCGDLCGVNGIGMHTALLLHIIPSLLRVYQVSQTRVKMMVLDQPDRVAEFLRPHFLGQTREKMLLLCLDDGGGVLYCDMPFEGTVNAVQVHLREIISIVLRCGATNVVMAHNHPRGIALPSKDDITVTDAVYHALSVIQVRLRDHYIFSADDYVSLRAAGHFIQYGST